MIWTVSVLVSLFMYTIRDINLYIPVKSGEYVIILFYVDCYRSVYNFVQKFQRNITISIPTTVISVLNINSNLVYLHSLLPSLSLDPSNHPSLHHFLTLSISLVWYLITMSILLSYFLCPSRGNLHGINDFPIMSFYSNLCLPLFLYSCDNQFMIIFVNQLVSILRTCLYYVNYFSSIPQVWSII